jgi:hypothetical protein
MVYIDCQKVRRGITSGVLRSKKINQIEIGDSNDDARKS